MKRGIVLWVDLRIPTKFEGQIYVYETNERYYFNYSVWKGPVGPWRDAPVTVKLDENNTIVEAI